MIKFALYYHGFDPIHLFCFRNFTIKSIVRKLIKNMNIKNLIKMYSASYLETKYTEYFSFDMVMNAKCESVSDAEKVIKLRKHVLKYINVLLLLCCK